MQSHGTPRTTTKSNKGTVTKEKKETNQMTTSTTKTGEPYAIIGVPGDMQMPRRKRTLETKMTTATTTTTQMRRRRRGMFLMRMRIVIKEKKMTSRKERHGQKEA